MIEYATWPTDRPEDADWQRRVIHSLEKTGASVEHVDAVRAEIGSVRYRPEEVAGAAAVDSLPAAFEDASARGAELVGILGRLATPQ